MLIRCIVTLVICLQLQVSISTTQIILFNVFFGHLPLLLAKIGLPQGFGQIYFQIVLQKLSVLGRKLSQSFRGFCWHSSGDWSILRSDTCCIWFAVLPFSSSIGRVNDVLFHFSELIIELRWLRNGLPTWCVLTTGGSFYVILHAKLANDDLCPSPRWGQSLSIWQWSWFLANASCLLVSSYTSSSDRNYGLGIVKVRLHYPPSCLFQSCARTIGSLMESFRLQIVLISQLVGLVAGARVLKNKFFRLDCLTRRKICLRTLINVCNSFCSLFCTCF